MSEQMILKLRMGDTIPRGWQFRSLEKVVREPAPGGASWVEYAYVVVNSTEAPHE